MEKTFGRSPAMKNQDQNQYLSSDVYGAAIFSSMKNETFELNNERSNIGDIHVSEKNGYPVITEDSTEKVSPTLLESAFNVVKTFFSPEKAKNKTSNSVNQHKSVSESTSNSVILPNKQKLLTSEGNMEIPFSKSSFSEENDLKDKKQLPVPLLSALTNDYQSNDDDESFLTTVSYNESFQSAVTHLDEIVEMTKNNDIFSNSIFNNSQDLDLGDSCNTSFENSRCSLENTMLKNDCFSLKDVNHDGFSLKNVNGNTEGFNGIKNCNGELQYADSQASIFHNETFKDHLNNATENRSDLKKVPELVGRFSSRNGDSNESQEKTGETVLKDDKRSNQISEQNEEPVFHQHESVHCSSNSADFTKMKKFETDDNFEFDEILTALEASPSCDTVHLTKSELNEVDKMLSGLEKDSGSSTSLNSLSGSDATVNENLTETSPFQYNEQNPKIPENKPEKQISPRNVTSDEVKGSSDEIDGPRDIQAILAHKATDTPIESQMSVISNKTHEKIGFIESRELQFEESSPASILQKSYTVLRVNTKLKLPVINSSNWVSVNNSLDASQNGICTYTEEIQGSSATINNCPGEDMFSVKHSTPVSVLRSSTSDVSCTEKLEMNSLEMNYENDDDQIKSKIPTSKSDFLGKAMEIFRSGEPLDFSIKMPHIVDTDALLAIESFDSGILPSKPPDEIMTTFESNETDNVTELLKENPVLNVTYETKADEKLKAPGFDETFDKKSESFESEKSELSKTVEIQQPVKPRQSDSAKFSSIANKTYDKVSNYEEVAFSVNKETDPTVSETKPPSNELNGIHLKESNTRQDSRPENGVNKIFEKSFTTGFVNDKERSGSSESHEVNSILSLEKEAPGSMGQTSYIFINENLIENDGDDDDDDDNEINKNIESIYYKEGNNSSLSRMSSTSQTSRNSAMVKGQIPDSSNQITEDLPGKLKEIHVNEVSSELRESPHARMTGSGEPNVGNSTAVHPPEFTNLSKSFEPNLAQLIEQQFTPSDIAKICEVANMSENPNDPSLKSNENETQMKMESVLSPKSFDFLSSIQGKPTGRDLSRESLYVKFDPLVQPPSQNSLIDFSKEVEALAASETSTDHSSSICEELLAISPEKKSDVIVPPLTPMSDKKKKDKVERLRELQNEIYFLKNLYSERERINKAKIEQYEGQIAKLTGDKCVLEDKLKEYAEREKSIVKKMTAQTRDINQLKVVMEEYIKAISVLIKELETLRKENAQRIEALTAEKDSYKNHLQNTEAAFCDVHTKYEKSKKAIESLKANEVIYRNTIAEHSVKMEEFRKKAKEVQEKAMSEFQKILLELNASKANHLQEVSRLRAQLKKTELKLEAVQDSLDQKIKENQQLTAICDELIEGKNENRR